MCFCFHHGTEHDNTHTHTQSVSSAPSGKHPHLPVLLSTNCLPLKKGPGQSEVPAVWCHLLLPACNWLISPAWKCPCVQTANKKKQEIKQQKTIYVYFIGGGGLLDAVNTSLHHLCSDVFLRMLSWRRASSQRMGEFSVSAETVSCVLHKSLSYIRAWVIDRGEPWALCWSQPCITTRRPIITTCHCDHSTLPPADNPAELRLLHKQQTLWYNVFKTVVYPWLPWLCSQVRCELNLKLTG